MNLDCFDLFPVLETERLRLRELSAKDTAPLYVERRGIRWAIVDRLEGGLLGTIGLNRIDVVSRAAVMGREIGRPAWRRGFARRRRARS